MAQVARAAAAEAVTIVLEMAFQELPTRAVGAVVLVMIRQEVGKRRVRAAAA